jgi:NADH dehydrogenase
VGSTRAARAEARRRARRRRRGDPAERIVAYDTLVFCVGSVNNDFGIPGVAERAISLDRGADAERFHRRCSRPAFAPTSARRAANRPRSRS